MRFKIANVARNHYNEVFIIKYLYRKMEKIIFISHDLNVINAFGSYIISIQKSF